MLLLIIGSLTLLSACASTYTREEEYARGAAIVLSKSMSTTTSFEKKWKTTNKVAIVDTFKNGEKDGEFKRYYLNGNLFMRGYYKDGKVVGVWEYYYTNGKLLMSGHINGSKEIDNWKYYDESGKLLGEVPFEQIPKEFKATRDKNIDLFWGDIKAGK